MSAVSILALVLVLSVLLWWGGRRRRAAPPAPAIRPATARAGWRRLLPLSRGQRLALWLGEAAPNSAAGLPPAAAAELSAWVVTLTPRALSSWERATRAFAAEVGIDLVWLWGHELDQDADLRAEIATMVLIYSLGYSRARCAAPMVAAVEALRHWRAAPNRARQRRFGDALHAALVRRGLLDIDPELFLAPERRRRKEAIAAIKRLDAEQHHEVRATVILMLADTKIAPLPSPSHNAVAPSALPLPTTIEDEAPDGNQLPAFNPRAA